MNTREILVVLTAALVTAALRFAPFILFPPGKKTPAIVLYLGRVLPYAVVGMLVVYCLRQVAFTAVGRWLPEAVSVALVALSYWYKRNSLLSIVAGTACYMILLRTVV
ncbi:MAG: branched-chain amino acid transporter AzlD [Clostridiales bacterium]|nr:branched-chain amino acid transporter AzlD [Clostridiales bacterium]